MEFTNNIKWIAVLEQHKLSGNHQLNSENGMQHNKYNHIPLMYIINESDLIGKTLST